MTTENTIMIEATLSLRQHMEDMSSNDIWFFFDESAMAFSSDDVLALELVEFMLIRHGHDVLDVLFNLGDLIPWSFFMSAMGESKPDYVQTLTGDQDPNLTISPDELIDILASMGVESDYGMAHSCAQDAMFWVLYMAKAMGGQYFRNEYASQQFLLGMDLAARDEEEE